MEKKIKKILDKNNKTAGNLMKGSNILFTYINDRKIKVSKHSYPYDFIGYVEVLPLLRGDNWGFTFYKKDIKSWDKRVKLDNYQIQAISGICSKLNKIL